MLRAILLVIALIVSSCGMEYSDGSRVGIVTKFSRKGLICKTWEGELKTGFLKSVSNDSGTSILPESFYFSTNSDEVAAQIQEALKSGDKVELNYIQHAFTPPCFGNAYKIKSVVKVK
jgi:hypothetical protein